MTDKWKEVWSAKSISDIENLSLADLIKANGFDAFSGFSVSN